ncbi:MAG: FecR family protein [Rhodocyclaceae bacterium]|nr:FecR family protein [Rhodocyclaceae bacterium]
MRFSDGAQVSLAPQTQFRIDEYRFAGKADGNEKGFFSLLKGAMRTITGLVGRSNRDNYKVSTTVATIGIRGTEYSVTYGNSVNVTTGEGSNEVCNAAGCLILNSGETAYIADNNTRPVMTDKKTEIPPPPAQEGQLPGFRCRR